MSNTSWITKFYNEYQKLKVIDSCYKIETLLKLHDNICYDSNLFDIYYVNMLEYYIDDKSYFNSEVESIKKDIEQVFREEGMIC